MSSRCARLLMLLATSSLATCAPSSTATTALDPDASNATIANHLHALPKTEHHRPGLEVLNWRIRETPKLEEMLLAATTPAFNDATNARLTDSAILVRTIPEAELLALLESIGGTNAAMASWCGQVTSWRNLHEVRIDNTVLQFNGESLRFGRGALGLAARGWAEPTIDSAHVHLEFGARFTPDRRAFSTVLSGPDKTTHNFPGLSHETDIARGMVVLITATVPRAIEQEVAPETTELQDDDPALEVGIPHRGARERSHLPLGQALFTIESEYPQRIVLVVVPRIPLSFMPEHPKNTQVRKTGARQ